MPKTKTRKQSRRGGMKRSYVPMPRYEPESESQQQQPVQRPRNLAQALAPYVARTQSTIGRQLREGMAQREAQQEVEREARRQAAAAEHRLGPMMSAALASSGPSRLDAPEEERPVRSSTTTGTTTDGTEELTGSFSRMNLGGPMDDLESRLRGFSITKTAKKGKGKRKGGKKTRKQRRKH